MDSNKTQSSDKSAAKHPGNSGLNGVITVNDGNNPTPEERDNKIANEQDTERLRSERQSVEAGKHNNNSL